MSERILLGLLFRSVAGRASTCIAACLLLVPQGSILAQAPPEPAVNASAGARVFGEKGCVKCHAVDGRGGVEAPDLAQNPKLRSFYDLASDMWNHGPEMVRKMEERGIRRPRLTSQEAGDLIAFLYTLDYFDPPGDPEAGQAVFTEKKCALCHQVGGVGGVIGPDLSRLAQTPSPIRVAAAMWNHGPAMSEAARARGIPRPRLSGTELADLIAYLESAERGGQDAAMHLLPGRADHGEELLTEKSCVDCHGEPGDGGRTAPDLARAGRAGDLIDFVAAMWNKAPAMLAAIDRDGGEFPRLESGEVADLVAYLYSVRYFAGAGTESRGRKILEQKGCLVCHTPDQAGAIGNATDVRLPAAVVASLWNHVATAGEPAAGASWPLFDGAEMADLMAYFRASTE